MKKRLILSVLLAILAVVPALGQNGNTVSLQFPGVPSGSCAFVMLGINQATGDLYNCFNGAWKAAGTTTGTGTVTTVSIGNLSPVFTAAVANASTTPAISFTLSTAAAHTYLGNPTGSTAAPGYNSLVGADIPVINLATTGNGGVTGNLPVANLNSGTSASSLTFWRGDGTWATPIGSGTVTTSGSPAANQVAIFSGATAITGTATDSTTTHALFATAGAPAFRAIVSGDIPTLNQNTTGNAGTATALAATPTQCSGSNFATGITASGNANCSAPISSVISVFGRTGAVTATSGDYTAAQVTNAFDTSANNSIGAHYFDVVNIVVPSNPSANTCRVYFDTGTGLLAGLNSAGASCIPTSGGGGSVTSVFGRTGAITSQSGDYTFAQIGSTPTTLSGYGITDAVPNTRTVNGKALSANITLGLASADFANQGTTTTILHGNAAGNPSFGSVVNADIAASTIDLTAKVTGILPGANGGTGNGFFTVSGPTTSLKTFTLPNSSSTILTDNAVVTRAQGGTGTGSSLTGIVRSSGTSAFTASELSGNVTTSGSNAASVVGLTFSGPTSISLGTAPSSGQVLGYNGTSIIGVSALTDPATTLGDTYYRGASAIAALAGPTGVNGVPQLYTETPSGGLATAPVWAPGGIVPNPQTGTTYTFLATDRSGYVTFSNASSIAVTLPAAGSTGFASNYVTSACAIAAGTATITPTTSTISYSDGASYTSGASSMPLSTGQCASIFSDNTNYFAILRKAGAGTVTSVSQTFTGGLISVGGSPVTGSGTLALTVAGTSGGVPFFSSSSAWGSSAALTANSPMLGGGAGSAPKTVSGITTDGTSVLTLGVAGTSVGSLALHNATSGTITLSPPTGALGTVTVTIPAATDTLVNLAGTQTLTNKSIAGSEVNSGQVALANGGTGAATQANAAIAIMPTATRAGDILYWDGSIWNHLAGNNSGTQVLQETSSGVPSWATSGGTGTVTSIATTGPIGGGTITTTGTITCTTCTTNASALTSNSLLLGAGSQATKVVAGIVSDGASKITLGVAGTSVGAVAMTNATSGSVTVQPVTGALGAVTASLPANTGTISETNLAETFSAVKTFSSAPVISTITNTGTLTLPTATGTLSETIASGTSAMGTGAISSGTCATVVTTTATGVAATDAIIVSPNADPTGVTGYAPSASGSLYIQGWPTSGNVNFKVCNNTSGSITPAALTLNWRVVR